MNAQTAKKTTDKKSAVAALAAARDKRKAELAKLSDQEKKVFVQKEKQARFVKDAEIRVSKALDILAKVKATASRKSYEYDATQAEKIITTLQAQVDGIKAAFTGSNGGSGFKL